MPECKQPATPNGGQAAPQNGGLTATPDGGPADIVKSGWGDRPLAICCTCTFPRHDNQ